MFHDPWSDLRSRQECHRKRRRTLDTFCSSLNFEVCPPSRVVGAPGGPFNDHAFLAPFTRIPLGACVEHQLPSLLDFYLKPVRQDSISDSWVDWLPAIGDHTLVTVGIACTSTTLKPRRGRFHCSIWDAAIQWMAEHEINIAFLSDADCCNAFFLNAQDALRDHRTCSQRRHDRVPPHIKSALAQVAECDSELE